MARYVRLSLKGGLGPTEVWSVNPVIDPRDEITMDFDQANFDAFTQAVAGITLPSSIRSGLSSAGNLRSVRAELRDTSSDTFIGASEYTLPTPLNGTGNAVKPPQSSFVSSLRSASALAAGRGRLYWPALGLATDASTLRMASGVPLTIASEVSSYLTTICNQAKASLTPISLVNFGVSVYSPTRRTLTPVTSIRVGDVIDTQRRRRDSMPEQYSSRVFPYTP